MNAVELYAVLREGPVRVDVPGEHQGFESLYRGLELGVYTALRTYQHNRFLDLAHHLRRTRASMSRLGMQHELDVRRLRSALHEVCTAWPGQDMRVRIDVLSAPATALGVNSRELIALAPFAAPAASKYSRGVSVVTTRSVHRDDPLTKSASFVEQRAALMLSNPEAEDCLLVGADGLLLEGASSNFYAVVDGALRTAGKGVLEGVTRAIVLDLARHRGLDPVLQPVSVDELGRASEAAISSSSRGVMPVVHVDGAALGDGVPGPVMSGLWADYQEYVEKAVQPAVSDS